jgi:hypothetical protein
VVESKIENQCRDRTPLARCSCSRETERPSEKSCKRWKKSKNGRPKIFQCSGASGNRAQLGEHRRERQKAAAPFQLAAKNTGLTQWRMKNCRGNKNRRADECPWHEQKNKLKKTSVTTKNQRQEITSRPAHRPGAQN